jgi:hypothetical protein
MRIRSTVSVEAHNKDTLEKKEKRDRARADMLAVARADGRHQKEPKTRGVSLIPTEWDRYNRSWVCTHVGTYVSRGRGIRKKKKTRASCCEASVRRHPVTW